jgi:hypothetical protein
LVWISNFSRKSHMCGNVTWQKYSLHDFVQNFRVLFVDLKSNAVGTAWLDWRSDSLENWVNSLSKKVKKPSLLYPSFILIIIEWTHTNFHFCFYRKFKMTATGYEIKHTTLWEIILTSNLKTYENKFI